MRKQTAQLVRVMTAAEAARRLHVTPQTIYRWLGDGILERYAAVEGKAVLVIAASIEKLLAEGKS